MALLCSEDANQIQYLRTDSQSPVPVPTNLLLIHVKLLQAFVCHKFFCIHFWIPEVEIFYLLFCEIGSYARSQNPLLKPPQHWCCICTTTSTNNWNDGSESGAPSRHMLSCHRELTYSYKIFELFLCLMIAVTFGCPCFVEEQRNDVRGQASSWQAGRRALGWGRSLPLPLAFTVGFCPCTWQSCMRELRRTPISIETHWSRPAMSLSWS